MNYRILCNEYFYLTIADRAVLQKVNLVVSLHFNSHMARIARWLLVFWCVLLLCTRNGFTAKQNETS